MPNWTFRVTHQNQTSTTGTMNVTLPGNGKNMVVPRLQCACGFAHTLTGNQKSSSAASGAGATSVAPANDPSPKPGSDVDDIPSWEGGPSNLPGHKTGHKK